MATSFEGWLNSWNGWGVRAFDPNALSGTASITLSAVGTLTAVGAIQRGGGKARKQRYVVDRFSDWPIRPPQESDDEECLLLMMI